MPFIPSCRSSAPGPFAPAARLRTGSCGPFAAVRRRSCRPHPPEPGDPPFSIRALRSPGPRPALRRPRLRRVPAPFSKECPMEASIQQDERTLTELDHVRVARLLRRASHPALDDVLDGARLVASRSVPPDVVTMYSQVRLADLRSGERSTLTLCYPDDAEPAAGFVSVLSPVGASLLGLHVGAIARWCTPGGDEAV